MKAMWQGEIVAESDDTVVVDGNHYFPAAALRNEYFSPNARRSSCPWKGEAHYYDIEVAGARNEAAAWCYPTPKSGAAQIEGRIAFWKGVEVIA